MLVQYDRHGAAAKANTSQPMMHLPIKHRDTTNKKQLTTMSRCRLLGLFVGPVWTQSRFQGQLASCDIEALHQFPQLQCFGPHVTRRATSAEVQLPDSRPIVLNA